MKDLICIAYLVSCLPGLWFMYKSYKATNAPDTEHYGNIALMLLLLPSIHIFLYVMSKE